MIYLDNAATTPLCDVAKNAIIENLDEFWNVNSSYDSARKLRVKVEEARENIAEMIGANSADEIYFTSSGSEANSWAINGIPNVLKFCSKVEHSSIVNNPNIHMIYGVDKNCDVQPDPIFPGALTSIMMVNNEIGNINNIKYISKLVHNNGGIMHSDMTQAMGHIPINVKDLNVDMATFSAHKFNGPKGCGVLYLKDGIQINPLIYGGSQEQHKRGGTTNALNILAMEAALKESITHMEERNEYVEKLRNKLADELLAINYVKLNGSLAGRVSSNLNICIDGISSQHMVSSCDLLGICISGGSACNEYNETPSHVLKAMGLSDEEALSSIRISLSHLNTSQEIDKCCDVLPKLIENLRAKNKR